MLLHGPFVGGAYKYIDPTPSRNVSDANSMLPPAALDATRAHSHRCGAGMRLGRGRMGAGHGMSASRAAWGYRHGKANNKAWATSGGLPVPPA